MDIDWLDFVTLHASPLETFLRGSFLYWFIFLLLRLAGRRDAGSVGVADLLVLVLIGDAAGNAMLPESASVADAAVMIATLIGWSAAADRLEYFFPGLSRVLAPAKVCLVKDGVLQRRGMRREYVTVEELQQAVRLAGFERIEQIKRAYMESNGEISVIAKEGEHGTPSQRPDLRSSAE